MIEDTETAGDMNSTTGAIDASATGDESVATPTKAAKPAKKTKAAATVEATVLKAFRCSVPQDVTLPPRVVQALTAGDAEQAYRKEMGIVTLGFPITIADYGDAN